MANCDSPEYALAVAKIDELRGLVDEIFVINELDLETLDQAIHALKNSLPLKDHGTIAGDVEGQK